MRPHPLALGSAFETKGPAGSADRHSCASAQSNTISMLWRTRLAVSGFSVHIGVNTFSISPVVTSLTGLWPVGGLEPVRP